MTAPRPASVKVRRACFKYWKRTDDKGHVWLDCYVCKRPLDPVRDKWIAEHEKKRWLDPDDEPPNVKPCCVDCEKGKTAKDNSETAKSKRISERHFGIRRPIGFHKPDGMKWNWRSRRYERETQE